MLIFLSCVGIWDYLGSRRGRWAAWIVARLTSASEGYGEGGILAMLDRPIDYNLVHRTGWSPQCAREEAAKSRCCLISVRRALNCCIFHCAVFNQASGIIESL